MKENKEKRIVNNPNAQTPAKSVVACKGRAPKGRALHAFGLFTILVSLFTFAACQEQHEHTAAAINDRDSVALMTSYGVNTVISDSGVMKYRIVSEQWEINQRVNPSRWKFEKGVLLEQFDPTFHVNSYIQCDTAYYYDQQRLWEMRGRVSILTKDGLRFTSEELFWDEQRHEIYSNRFSRLVTPERTLQGAYFRSDEQMTRYMVSNTRGSFERSDIDGTARDTARAATDSTAQPQRQPMTPRKKQPAPPLTH